MEGGANTKSPTKMFTGLQKVKKTNKQKTGKTHKQAPIMYVKVAGG